MLFICYFCINKTQMKTILLTAFLLAGSMLFGQQNEEFRLIKQHFDRQENLLKIEFVKKYNNAFTAQEKETVKKDFTEFMLKLDSIRNTAYLGALIRVKNVEELEYLKGQSSSNVKACHTEIDEAPEFPNGIDALREKVASLFYSKGIEYCKNELNTTVSFVVDENGSITDIKAEGENISFNKQAEIAMYLISEKFTKPALQKGNAVKYAFRMPLSIKFE